ncbi:hypothetical protein CDV55_106604 [Aspergillus turcosus]|nr:hypothetical protein CDV55_106604 [Aspergillus turcosus]
MDPIRIQRGLSSRQLQLIVTGGCIGTGLWICGWYVIAVFFPGKFTAADFLVSYIVFAVFFFLYVGHKLWYRTPWMTEVADINMFSGKEEVDRLCENDFERSWLERTWRWIA